MSALTFETYQPSINNMILSEATHDDIMTLTILEKGNTSNHQFQSQPITSGTQHEPSLNTALLLIQKLEQKLLSMESVHQRSQREMEKRIEKLEKENKELRHTVGPKISYLLQKPHQLTEDSPTHNPTTSTQSTTANNAVEHRDKHGDEEEWTTVTHGKYQKMKTPSSTKGPSNAGKSESIRFQIEKIAIIGNITNTDKTNSDDKVRRDIGKHIDKVITDRITHYPIKKINR